MPTFHKALLTLLLIPMVSLAGSPKKFLKQYQKGKVYFNKINYVEALPYFELAEKEAKKAGVADTSFSNLLADMAEAYYGIKDMTKAEDYYALALAAKEKAPGIETLSYLKTLTGQGKFLYRSQKHDKASAALLRSLPLFEKTNQKNTLLYGETLNILGNTALLKGDYITAEYYLVNAAAVIKSTKGESNIEYASAQNNLAVVYSMLTDYPKAEKSYTELLTAREKINGKTSPDYATALTNRGTLYVNIFNNILAEKDFETALSIYEKSPGKNDPLYATALNNIGILYRNTEQWRKARKALTEALSIRETIFGKENAAYATSLHNLGALYNDVRDSEPAYQMIAEARDIRERVLGKQHPDFISSLDELGMNKLYQEKFKEARPYFLEAIAADLVFIQKNFAGMSEREKTGFVNNHEKYFSHFYRYCASVAGYRSFGYKLEPPKSDPELMGIWYDTRLATKGIILNSIQRTRTRIINSGDAALIEQFTKWEKLKNDIAQHQNLSIAERAQKQIDLAKMSEQADAEEKKLSLASEAFRKNYETSSPSWKDIQAKLKKGEAAVELIRIAMPHDTIYAALLVTPDVSAPQVVILPEGKKMEKKNFRYYQNCIRYKILDEISYQSYWKPIATALKSLGKITKLYLSQDGIYHQLNVGTLYNTETNRYLFEEIDLYLLSNTKEILDIASAELLKRKALLIGNPDFRLDNSDKPIDKGEELTRSYKGSIFTDLPGTDKELKNINSTLMAFGWKTQVLTRQEALEDRLKLISNPSVVHIATHGFFMNSSSVKDIAAPMLSSGIALAGVNAKKEYAKKEDGILTAYEAMNLDLDSTELVVLSACETGLGETKTGEGIYGIQRGFRVSGAKTIVMSLWKVDDAATQELMTTFYKEWIATGNKRLAFRKAQQAMKAKYIHPYFWGAFVMVGK